MDKFFRGAFRDIIAGIELLLVVRVFLMLFAANPETPIVAFWYSVTDALMAPVQYIFPTPHIVGGSTFDLVAIAAMVFYGILFYVVLRIVRLLSGKSQHPTMY